MGSIVRASATGPCLGLVRVHLGDALSERCLRRISRAFGFQRRGVALQISLAGGLDLVHGHDPPSRCLQHLREQIRAQRKIVVGILAFADQVMLEIAHRIRRVRIRVGKLLLQIRIADRCEHRSDASSEKKSARPPKLGDAELRRRSSAAAI
jgi:hypothetical protein